MPELEPPAGWRRAFYRNERRLIVVYLVVLVGLNALPFAWRAANRAWGVEQLMTRAYRWTWRHRVEKARELKRTRGSRSAHEAFKELLHGMPAFQLRSTHGRMRQSALLDLARLDLAEGLHKRAEAEAREVIRVDPNDYRGWQALGDALWASGSADEAVAAYRKALEPFPTNEPVVQRLVSYLIDRAEYERAVQAFKTYWTASWCTDGFLYFMESFPDRKIENRLVIPVLVDGRLHAYRLPISAPRGRGEFRFRAMPAIGGFELSPVTAANVVAEIRELEVLRARRYFEPPPPPVLVERSFEAWEPTGGLRRAGGGRWLTVSAGSGLRVPVRIGDPGGVAEIRVTMALHRPLSRGLARLVRRAYHNLMRDAEAERLLGPAPVYDARPAAVPAPVPVRPPAAEEETATYSIAVAGHVRRGASAAQPVMASLLAALPEVARTDLMLVLTGDVVWEGTAARWDAVERLLLEPLPIPLVIAPGNHDLHDGGPGRARSRFEARFGPSWRTVKLRRTLLMVLDTELAPGDISGVQLAGVVRDLEAVANDPGIRHVVVCMHRVLWFGHKRYREVALRANRSSRPDLATRIGRAPGFWEGIFPVLKRLASTRRVVVIAGDIGTWIPLVYDRIDGVELVASGNRAQDPPAWWNHLLRVHLDGGRLTLEAVGLGGRPLGRVDGYTTEFWHRHPGQLRPGEVPR